MLNKTVADNINFSLFFTGISYFRTILMKNAIKLRNLLETARRNGNFFHLMFIRIPCCCLTHTVGFLTATQCLFLALLHVTAICFSHHP